MIAQLTGTVIQLGPTSAVVEVGGFGVLVLCGPNTTALLRVGERATLSTSLVVREDSLTLYGFANDDERDMFEQVQTVSGVGPRLALAMLSVMAPDRIRAAISGSDIAALTKVPGIGKKGAERMVLELRDKIGVPTSAVAGAAAQPPAGPQWRDQVTEALVGLGWTSKQAEDAVGRVAATAAESPNVSEMLRAALRELGR